MIEHLDKCLSLIELSLNNNYISNLAGLLCLKNQLQYLNISNNRIQFIGDLKCFTQLEEIHLEGNNIESLDELLKLKDLPKLKSLCLKDYFNKLTNPVCNHPAYITTIITNFPNLEYIDGEQVKLKKMIQEALLNSIYPDNDIKIPEIKPWLNGIDLSVKPINIINVNEEKELRNGLNDCNDLIKQADEYINQIK